MGDDRGLIALYLPFLGTVSDVGLRTFVAAVQFCTGIHMSVMLVVHRPTGAMRCASHIVKF